MFPPQPRERERDTLTYSPKGQSKLVEMQGRCRDGPVQPELVPVPTRGEDWSEGLRAELT